MQPSHATHVFARISPLVQPFVSHSESLRSLQALPRGYALCYALHHVEADVLNGGFQQLHHNSTWDLMPSAIVASEVAGETRLAHLLGEVVRHYHELGECRMDDQECAHVCARVDGATIRPLEQVEQEFFDIDLRYIEERTFLVERLAAVQDRTLWGEDHPAPVPIPELTPEQARRQEMFERLKRELAEKYKDERPE